MFGHRADLRQWAILVGECPEANEEGGCPPVAMTLDEEVSVVFYSWSALPQAGSANGRFFFGAKKS